MYQKPSNPRNRPRSNKETVKRSFWTDPEGFSVVDLLALMFSITFLSLLVYGFFNPDDHIKDYVSLLSPSVAIILGGYFTNQTVQQYSMYRNNNYIPNQYNVETVDNNNVPEVAAQGYNDNANV